MPVVLGMLFDEIANGRKQKCLAAHGRRIGRHREMEPSESGEELAVRNDGTTQVWQYISSCNVQHELSQGLRTEAQRPVEISFLRCWLTGMRFTPVDEERLPCRRRMPGAAIGVLLDSFLHYSDDEMFVRMTRESVLHITRMNDLCFVRRIKPIDTNPLSRRRHRNKIIPRRSGGLSLLERRSWAN